LLACSVFELNYGYFQSILGFAISIVRPKFASVSLYAKPFLVHHKKRSQVIPSKLPYFNLHRAVSHELTK
jgi:hypothetical protein